MSFLLCSLLKPHPTTYHSNRWRCLNKISNRIGHVYLTCSNFCNLLYWWCARISAHAASSERLTFPRKSTRMFSDCWMSISKLLTPPLGYLISSKIEKNCVRVNGFMIYQWHEDRQIIQGFRFLLIDDDETLSFSQCLTLTLCNSVILEGILLKPNMILPGMECSPQPDPKYIHISVRGKKIGQNSSVSKSNRLHVLVFWVHSLLSGGKFHRFLQNDG